MSNKKWYLKRNISCGAHLLNELRETDVPWDDTIVVSAGKLRKLLESLSELRSSVCERRLERRPALLPVKTAQFTQFFSPVRYDVTSKIAQFNWQCVGRLGRSVFHALIRRVHYLKGNDKCGILYDETGDPDCVWHGNCCSQFCRNAVRAFMLRPRVIKKSLDDNDPPLCWAAAPFWAQASFRRHLHSSLSLFPHGLTLFSFFFLLPSQKSSRFSYHKRFYG